MPEPDAWDEATREVRRRVDEGRASGRYPEELDAQLESDFARAAKDPLLFDRLEAAREQLNDLEEYSFGRARIELTSEMPGGSAFHRVIGKTISRSITGVLGQVSDLSLRLQSMMGAILDADEQIRDVLRNDVLADIDELHHRMAAIEQRLGRLEADHDRPVAIGNDEHADA